MTGCCLTEEALERVLAELATATERAHLASCAACTGRYRELQRDLASITGVLRDPVMGHSRPARRLGRRWMPAPVPATVPASIALSVIAAALLIWVEVAVWRAAEAPPTMQPQEVAAILSDVSASLFSVSGDPALTAADETAPSLEAMAAEVDGALTGGTP